ncbi:MAG: hypothetical protein FJY55_04130 [Betaproteobacteria bacterium]|nr:hypothetical protein [Betaproteobacteria bacterium]
MKCKPGDLAIVINAQISDNLGNIVRILRLDDGSGKFVFKGQGRVWIVASPRPMTWALRGKQYRDTTGPVPENRLQPIRGLDPGRRAGRAAARRVTTPKGKEQEQLRIPATLFY